MYTSATMDRVEALTKSVALDRAALDSGTTLTYNTEAIHQAGDQKNCGKIAISGYCGKFKLNLKPDRYEINRALEVTRTDTSHEGNHGKD